MMARLNFRASMDLCLLALDTSTEAMALALETPSGTFTLNEAGGPAASARLLPALLQLLGQAGLSLQQLDAIAFGAGPGAFTGLRTACAVAQGLAFGAGKPVLALDSLQIVAEDAEAQFSDPDPSALMWVAVDARMDEAYAAAYRRVGAGWQVVAAPALYTLDALAEAWRRQPPRRIAGNALTAFGGRLPVAGARCEARVVDRAAALGRLARAAWAHGTRLDPAEALPMYLRDKVALTTAERERQAARSAA